ncbi:hypothetical protein [Pseudomonas fulva]|uniref:hypothetical protein n=1 Tax=Pseudomonas fulva TaxID=47880 RepID=UPI0011B04D33|nr:hypothetical protein [Pseudomonas fulva]
MITTAGPGQTNDQAAQAIRDSIADQTGRVTAREGTVTALGNAVSRLTSRVNDQTNTQAFHDQDGYITGEKLARQAAENAPCRADSDMALAQRIESLQSGLAGAADASAACTLTSRKYSEGSAELHIKPGEAVELLRMGKFVFHGETARQIRAAQTVLRQAGAGQLEVVKRVEDPGSPFVVIDDQVFITGAMIKSATLNPVEFKVRLEVDDKGQYYAAGLGVGVAESDYGKALEAGQAMEYISGLVKESALGSSLHEQVRQVIRDELKPGGMLRRG